MAHLDPKDSFDHFKERVTTAVQEHFPIKGQVQSLHLTKIEVPDVLNPNDIRAQHKAKVEGGTWAAPVYAHVQLKDNTTGKVVSSGRMKIAEIPKTTQRFSYILDGQEYQVDNQWQLRPGVYARRRQNGELESRFNVAGKSPFDVTFSDDTKKFVLEYGKSKLPLYPIMKTMGVSDAQLESTWGKEILEANKNAHGAAGTVARFHKLTSFKDAGTHEEMEVHVRKIFEDSKLRPEATKLTLGKPFEHVDGEVLHLATQKLLKVQAGHPEDDRDSLLFKDLRSVGDYAYDKIAGASKTIKQKAMRNINTAKDFREVLKPDMFATPLSQAFLKNSCARVASQINPVEMVSSAQQTTIMGAGGIQSDRSVTQEAKMIDDSHIGFLDPINTPEGGRTGVTLRLPIGVKKVGHEAKVELYNLKTGKSELLSPLQVNQANVAFSDQFDWKNGKPTPRGKVIKAATEGNQVREIPVHEATHTFYHPSQLFNLTSNLVPFMNSTSAGRIGMATRHIEQAISLRDREAPLVQAGTGIDKPGLHTFEHVMGQYAAHQAPVAGKVVAVKADGIHIQDAAGKKHEVQLYNNFPLNDAKSSLTSTPLVKVGDTVRERQVVADTNYSKNGQLALGTNLRVGYMSWKGINYEDGIVISKSAAEKLTSEHMSKPSLQLQDNHVLDKKRFQVHLPLTYTQEQLAKLDDKGVVRVGQKVRAGDPLIAAMKPFELKDRVGLGAFQKSKVGTHTDSSLRWDSGFEGTVTAVHHTPDGIQVHVKTQEEMKVGDKMSSRNANKGVVAAILPDHEMPKDKDGKPLQVMLNYTGVGGRINLSQMYEVAASKIARKTGKPYIVENFTPGVDNLKKLQGELKAHGLADTEEVFDPHSGKSLGHILTGEQHMFKLVHQIDKKESVRSGMTLPGEIGGESYDINLQPTSGSHSGGQSMGALGTYALLAHGANANLREIMTLKAEGEDPQTDPAKRWKHNDPSSHRATWTAIQQGTTIPNPKPTFAYEKFVSMLKGAGINVEKKGHEIITSPLTDKQILALSGGREIPKPAEMVYGKSVKGTDELKPKPGGLFDEKLTGGHGGTLWSHIKLAEPTPNPLFLAPIRALTGLSGKEYEDVLYGRKGVGPNGALVPPSVGLTSGAAIKALLDKIDVNKELPKARKALDTAKPKDVDKQLKKVKYLTALSELKMSPSEAYILHHLPVIPPAMRPVSALPSGDVKFADINGLYNQLGQTNSTLQDKTLQANWTEERKAMHRQAYHEAVAAVIGVGVPYKDQKLKGLLHQIAGGQPKCFDGETEVLTVHGWVRLDQYNGRDNIGTVNLEHDAFEWQKPSAFHVTPYTGAMHRLQGSHIDLLVTPNHNHVLSRMTWDKGRRTWGTWGLCASETLLGPKNRSRLMIAAKHWDGEMRTYTFDEHAVDPVTFAAFVGWWVAEGWTDRGKYVYIPQTTPRGIEILDAMFRELGLPYYRAEYVKKQATAGLITYWRIKSKELADWLTLHVGNGCENKHLSPEILSWHPAMLRALLEGYLDGDGDSSTKGKRKVADKRTHMRMSAVGARFSTVSPLLIGDLQHLAVKVGLQVTASRVMRRYKDHRLPQYRATVRGFRDVSFGEHLRVKVEEFSGLVYGPTVANGTVVVRRQGVVSVSGNSGFYQGTLMAPRQDLSMRSVIIPGPHLGLDEVGLPKEYAKKLFEPFLVKKLTEMGAAPTSLAAQTMLAKNKDKSIDLALEKVMAERPVLMKRDPALHAYSVQGFHPRIASSKAIEMHPMVCGGFNADFDGDTASIYVPLSKEAVDEAHKMVPSRNLFSKATGKLMYTPTLEYAMGMYKLSDVGKKTEHKFTHPADVLTAFQDGKVKHNDVVQLGAKETTPGRILLATAVPDSMQDKVMHNLDMRLDKKGAEALLSDIGKKHPDLFSAYANRLKDLGSGASTGYIEAPVVSPLKAVGAGPIMKFHLPAHTLTLADLEVDHATRDPILAKAKKEVEAIHLLPGLTQAERDRRAIAVYAKADDEMYKMHTAKASKDPNHLMQLNMAGIKPGRAQYQQIVLAPMLMKNSKNETIPNPITKSYSEGLDLGSYWTGMHGARRGAVMKVQEVQEPGYLSKLLVNTTMNQVVTAHDCGTHAGVTMPVGDSAIHDRHLAKPFSAGSLQFAAGTVLTPEIVGKIRAADKDAQLVVRSPLKCAHDKGVCQKCMGLQAGGLVQMGANVGIQAAQSIGERAVQLTLKEFHTGGSATGSSKATNAFVRFQQLTQLPQTIKNSATLAMHGGTIEKVTNDATGTKVVIAGKVHHVGRDSAGNSLATHLPGATNPGWTPPAVGTVVKPGQFLSDPGRTVLNPHDLYKATGSMATVQSELVREMHDIYKSEGVDRRHIELLVRAMGGISKVQDSGGHPTYLRGEFHPTTQLDAVNRELVAKGQKPIDHSPVLKGVAELPLIMHDDWMAKLQHKHLRATLADAAATRASSDIHGVNPLAGLAYGAEFGRTSKDSLNPSFSHLKNVPGHLH